MNNKLLLSCVGWDKVHAMSFTQMENLIELCVGSYLKLMCLDSLDERVSDPSVPLKLL